MTDSGAWKAGLREDIMDGVRRRTEGLGVVEGVELAWRCGCEKGRIWRSGRKVWSVRIGVRRRVLRRSETVLGARVAIGEEG